MIDRRILLSAAGCILFAAIIVAELDGGDDVKIAAPPATAAAPAAVVDRPQPAPVAELLATTLARPLFSVTRRPAEGTGPTADFVGKRLAGIVIEPDRRLAIFAAAADKPLVLGEGESVDGWRIETITPHQVLLRGPGGSETLQPKIDPNLAPPRPQPAVNRPAVAPAPARPAVAAPAPAAAQHAPAVLPGALQFRRPATTGRRG